jgi:hypothetical protein
LSVRRLIAIFTVVASLSLSATALADSTTQDGYATKAGQVAADVVASTPSRAVKPSVASAPTAAVEAQTTGNTLPFTGLDVVWVVLAGAALMGVGVATRRLSRD